MADLTTHWLGLRLSSPLVVAAGPVSRDPATAVAAVEAGAAAVVMHSLFEEELVEEQLLAHRYLDGHADMNAEASRFMPDTAVFGQAAQAHLDALAGLRARLPRSVPVIASLNGTTPGGWVEFAESLAAAGADALELNLYDVSTDAGESGADVEARQIQLVAAVVSAVQIPVAVKLTAFYASLPAFVRRLREVGARGVTVFNRLHEPVVDLDTLEVHRSVPLASTTDLSLRLHALAVLSPCSELSLACSGGIRSADDAARAMLCGAHAIQLGSALLEHGPGRAGMIRDGLNTWLDGKGYRSYDAARAVLALDRVPDPTVWTRLNYVRTLQAARGTHP